MRAASPILGRGRVPFALNAVVVVGFVVGAFLAGPASALGDCNGAGNCTDDHSINQAQGQGQGQHQGQAQGQAQGQGQHQSSRNYNTNVNTNVNVSESESYARSTATAIQGQAQGNKQSFEQTIEAPDLSRLAPASGIGGLYPSANCHGTSNAGGSGPGFSVQLGTSWKDEDCGIRETARLFGVGTPDGIAVLCSSSYAAAAPSCKKLAAQKKAEEATAVKLVEDQRARPISPPAKSEGTKAGASARPWYAANPEFVAK